MNSLIELLNHPYHILNHLAGAMYSNIAPTAAHQRLRSRAKGLHHFTPEEYKTLREMFGRLAKTLERFATRLETPVDGPQPNWLTVTAQPWLNHKKIMEATGEPLGLSYVTIYDALRGKRTPPEGLLPALASHYRQHATWIRTQLDQSKAERSSYAFSAGRGKRKREKI